MASSLFIRVLNPRSLYINNGTVAVLSNLRQRCSIKSCLYTTESISMEDNIVSEGSTKKPISKAMKAYLERAKQYNEFLQKETALFDIGKRHLANMMGEDPETFTQQDIDRAIEYLFPSGLYEPRARPLMRPPQEIFPAQKAAQIDESGRPFHSMYYTLKPSYYEMIFNIAEKLRYLDQLEDMAIKKGALPPQNKIDTVLLEPFSQAGLEKLLLEPLSTREHEYYLSTLARIVDHPLSNHVEEFIKKYMKIKDLTSNTVIALPIQYDDNGRGYVTVKQCRRKSATAEVTVWSNGTGKITINGQDITYFENLQHREQESNATFQNSESVISDKFMFVIILT